MSEFVKRSQSIILDKNSNEFLLKGVGIGGWLLIEGYMIKSNKDIDRPRRIQDHISKMTSSDYMNHFKKTWEESFFTAKDIRYIKECGFNSIRIPIDYEFLFTENNDVLVNNEHGFILLDKILNLCSQEQIYVILDIHAAPGGQTGTNIDNSEYDEPLLFMDIKYQDQLCFVWEVIAKRYRNEKWIAAYDIINEPLPNWQNKYNDKLIPLYKRVIERIREFDQNHMITLEGLHWSTDLSCFTEILDTNILLQFHKYWSNPDTESIQDYLALRKKLNVPLFMGEGGENNTRWYSAVFKLYDEHKISYNFWTYKKMSNNNSLISFNMPERWTEFLNGTLSKKDSTDVLESLLRNIKFDHSKINESVSNHILRKNTYSIPAYAYDINRYYTMTKHNSSFRVNDGVSITDHTGNVIETNFKQYAGENIPDNEEMYVSLFKNEFLEYSIDCTILSILRIHVSNDKAVKVFINRELVSLKKSNCWILNKGLNIIQIQAIKSVILDKLHICSLLSYNSKKKPS